MAKTIKLFGFPSDATVQKVKLFLQRLTGEDSIYAIILADPKNEGIYDATVEFDSTENAESIISLARASEGLRYDSSTFKAPYYLTAKKMKYDLIPNPRIFVRDLELILVHFGCKIANEKFHILWTAGDVSVDFGSLLHKEVRFLLPYPLEYRLDLSYENIGQIELHRPLDTLVDYLLIQLNGAPRIYAKKLHQDYEDLDMKYFKDNPNDQWIRSVDFTPSYCIGQSSAICLELPYGCQLPDYIKCVASYKVRIGNFILQTSSALSCYHDLVPIVDSPPSVDLPYSILFKINLLVQHGRLSWPTLDEDFYKLVDSSQPNSHLIEYALNQLFHLKEICYEPSKLLKKYTTSETDKPPPRESLDSGEGLTASDVRAWMGNFSPIRNVAKCAARLGQSFSSSIETLNVDTNEIEVINDVSIMQNGVEYVFSDGIGKISVDFAKEVASKCGLEECIPSAFQIRYGGYKGVVPVNPTSSMKLSLRKSMCKSESKTTKLDVLAWSKLCPCFLNRQLITLLSTLGVQDDVFKEKQRFCIRELAATLNDPFKAQNALDLISSGEITNILKELLSYGYEPNVEPFVAMMLRMFKEVKLMELRTKTRILIPDGRSLMGCLDETGTLEYRQFFYDSVTLSGKRFIVEEQVVVGKSPCLHPGDVQVLMAVDVLALHHMVDCVVFPQKGPRPHPDECSGSDLDGDIYFVSWDPELIRPRKFPPMDYSPMQTKELDHEFTVEEIADYFVDYTVSDSLGRISNAHTIFADNKHPMKAQCNECIELAKLFSCAVDFAKTGVPAKIPDHLRPRDYPDFMEKPNKRTYESSGVIGVLYRDLKDIALHDSSTTPFSFEISKKSYDPDMEVDGFEYYLEDSHRYKSIYDDKLRSLMEFYGIKTEAELLGTSFMRMPKYPDKSWNIKSVDVAVRSLGKEVRGWFDESGTSLDAGADDNLFAKASAWYCATYHPSYFGKYNAGEDHNHFISFPGCVYDKLIDIKKRCSTL
ncbi:hypothetical protein C1H46_024761 [Malus baccata]|uniref:RNA-dependent RNA polymerase n=1 Tax=Malus baccata TaxID=106549 RepID=A0A540LT95_MALBA|nr:hypothetical protein C1H46_024761 [Malus baccata]